LREKEFCKILFDASERAAFISDENDFLIAILQCKRIPKKLDDQFMSIPITIAMDRNHLLLPDFEKVVQLVSSSGLLLYFEKYLTWFKYIRGLTIKDSSEPEVFDLNRLSFGFVIWLGVCGLAFISFSGEKIYFFVQKETFKRFNSIVQVFLSKFIRFKKVLRKIFRKRKPKKRIFLA
jgi:hypothetical protein